MFSSAITDKFMILQFNDVYIFDELNQRSILLLDTYPQQCWITNATYCVRYVTLPTGPHASVGRWQCDVLDVTSHCQQALTLA